MDMTREALKYIAEMGGSGSYRHSTAATERREAAYGTKRNNTQ